MTIKDVQDTLETESALLKDVAKFVRNYPNADFNGSARFIQESWALFLEQRSRTNQNVAAAGLVDDMQAEREQLEAYIGASDPAPAYSEKWKEFFQCEANILDHLMEKCT